MTEQTNTAYRDLVRFRSELPEHVLEAAVRIEALQLSAPTGYEHCEYCSWIEDACEDDETRPEVCEHYERLGEAWEIEHKEIRPEITKEEEDLLSQDDRLKWAARFAERDVVKEESRKIWPDGDYYLRDLWQVIPEGYYAVPDPRADVEEMTYWRRKDGKRGPTFKPWPLKARYGPALYKKDVPAAGELRRLTLSKNDYVRAWFKVNSHPYRDAIVEAILEDPIAAGQRFADFNTRCCMCGKALTHELSKVYGIGPECRKGMPAEVLANYARPMVGRAHAVHLGQKGE